MWDEAKYKTIKHKILTQAPRRYRKIDTKSHTRTLTNNIKRLELLIRSTLNHGGSLNNKEMIWDFFPSVVIAFDFFDHL